MSTLTYSTPLSPPSNDPWEFKKEQKDVNIKGNGGGDAIERFHKLIRGQRTMVETTKNGVGDCNERWRRYWKGYQRREHNIHTEGKAYSIYCISDAVYIDVATVSAVIHHLHFYCHLHLVRLRIRHCCRCEWSWCATTKRSFTMVAMKHHHQIHHSHRR